MTVEDLLAPYRHVEVTEADRKRAKDCVFVPIEKVIAAHRIATEQALADRAGHLVVAYHMAICSPKGVVPNDDFYDPAMAAELERRLGNAIRAGSTGDKG